MLLMLQTVRPIFSLQSSVFINKRFLHASCSLWMSSRLETRSLLDLYVAKQTLPPTNTALESCSVPSTITRHTCTSSLLNEPAQLESTLEKKQPITASSLLSSLSPSPTDALNLNTPSNISCIESSESHPNSVQNETSEYTPDNTLSRLVKGTRFELTTMHCLSKLNFDLKRTGGTGDNGIDLTGYWRLGSANKPGRKHTFPVVVQCKANARRIGTPCVRELEGVLSRRDARCLGFLVSSEGFSSKALRYMESSKMALVLVHLSDKMDPQDDFIKDFKMNPSAQKLLPHLDYAVARDNGVSLEQSGRMVLLWNDAILYSSHTFI